jgi:hypothetical protein
VAATSQVSCHGSFIIRVAAATPTLRSIDPSSALRTDPNPTRPIATFTPGTFGASPISVQMLTMASGRLHDLATNLSSSDILRWIKEIRMIDSARRTELEGRRADLPTCLRAGRRPPQGSSAAVGF